MAKVASFVLCLCVFGQAPRICGAQQTMNVCDLLKSLDEKTGKEVIVEGRFVDTDHGSWLSAEECGSEFRVKGHVWRSRTAIYLVPDRRSVPDVQLKDSAKDPLRVRVTGLLKALKKYESVPWSDGKKRPVGFGHLNLAVAEISYSKLVAVRPLDR